MKGEADELCLAELEKRRKQKMNESEPKFTPGPWERVQKGIPLKKPTLLTLGKWETKLAVYHNDLEICIITDTSNAYYNASLIAAAPEMYDLLERLPSDIRHLLQSGNTDMCKRIVGKIDAILKKAGGER